MSVINTLKYYGRRVVLPVDEIKNIVRQILMQNNVSHITDFGAGTLFWSRWFADELGLTVSAVDTAYIDSMPKNHSQHISIQTNIIEALETEKTKKCKRAIFICDVIHHLPPEFWRSVLALITESVDVVIIKDIDANRRLGNFCNKMHDRIINGEKIHNVYPSEIENHLTKAGFATTTKALPKLWYPHFIITGVKDNG